MQTEHTTIYETPVQITVSDEKVYAYLQVEPDAVMCFVGEAPITKEAVVAYCREYLMSDLAKGRSVQYKDTFILRGKRKKIWLLVDQSTK